MRKCILGLFACFFFLAVFAQADKNVPTIYVDKQGVMRWSDTKQEASFFGVNYTTPFAHAYRALQYKEIDHKEAIDRDVYHLVRLGFNAYRIHIWDVEIADGEGNLLENEHLELLDYLLFRLQENGVRILITAMTNFGNGYPERNVQTGGFSYLYDKCQIHANPQAIAAQKQYITGLLRHVNPYTGLAYQDDPYVVGFEINNEPCHTGEVRTTEHYIREMLAAMKKAGNKKPVFYNVSHNMEHVPAYFKADVQGTTYQWYPIGLVAGKERKGNFLPYVARYDIPFANEKGFTNKAKAVYEYDPADIVYSYIHPAMSRTFRANGFQWITQFAYDPLDMAAYNTEYQTHYLNLAYTPAKAISMMIAAETAYRIPRNQSFPAYPQDTLYGDFMVSYEQDLAVMNVDTAFYYTNNTDVWPKSAKALRKIAGHGSSPVVAYSGSGTYFLDKLQDGVWRLEVMPDAETVNDPFAKPSLSREVVQILWSENNMEIHLPDLGEDFSWKQLAPETSSRGQADGTAMMVTPGVYILGRKDQPAWTEWNSSTVWNRYPLGHFVAPAASVQQSPTVVHTPAGYHERGKDLAISLHVVSAVTPDSVIVQTDEVSFWRDDNTYIKLENEEGYRFIGRLPQSMLRGDRVRYTATVFVDGKKYTFPQGTSGAPLDWDTAIDRYWTTEIVDRTTPIVLAKSLSAQPAWETYAIPETAYSQVRKTQKDLMTVPMWSYTFARHDSETKFFWLKDIKQVVAERKYKIDEVKNLMIAVGNQSFSGKIQIGFVSNMGYTYAETVELEKDAQQTLRVPLKELSLVPTALLPAPYPTFLERYFVPVTPIPFVVGDSEKLIISTDGAVDQQAVITIGAVWME